MTDPKFLLGLLLGTLCTTIVLGTIIVILIEILNERK